MVDMQKWKKAPETDFIYVIDDLSNTEVGGVESWPVGIQSVEKRRPVSLLRSIRVFDSPENCGTSVIAGCLASVAAGPIERSSVSSRFF